VKLHLQGRGRWTRCNRIVSAPVNQAQHIDPAKNRAVDAATFYAAQKKERCADCESRAPRPSNLPPPTLAPAGSAFGCTMVLQQYLSLAAPPPTEEPEWHHAELGAVETACERPTKGREGVALRTHEPRRVTCPTCRSRLPKSARSS